MLKSIYKKSILFIFGLICCSPLSTYISIKIGLPFGVPEVFALFFFPFFTKEFIQFYRLLINNIIKIYIVFFTLLSLGLIFNIEYIPGVFASSRAYLYLFIFYFYGTKINFLNLNKLFIVALGAVLGGYLNGILLGLNTVNVQSYSNVFAFLIVISYPLIKRKDLLFIICLFFTLYVSFYSGLRRIIVEIIFCLFFILSLIFIRDKLKTSKVLVSTFFILPSLFLLFIDYIKTDISLNNPHLFRRIFLKTEKLSTSNAIESQGTRGDHFLNLFNYIVDTIFPKGIYPRGRSFNVNDSGGSTLDFPLYELFYVFGSFFVLCVIIYFVLLFFKYVKIISKNKNEYTDELILVVVCFLMILLISFFDGGFLQYTFVTPFTGLMLGRFVYFKNIGQNR